MRKQSHMWLLFAALSLIGSATANGQEVKTAYGFSDSDPGSGKGVYTFDIKSDTVDNIQLLQGVNCDNVSASYMLDDKYYYLDYTQNQSGYKSNGFYSLDLDSKAIKTIVDYGGVQQGPIICHLAWDAQSQTMYGLNDLESGSGLSKINLETGVISKVCEFTFTDEPEPAKSYDNFHTLMDAIAVNYDGEMYGVSYWGGLYKINTSTGVCQYIAPLDYNPDKAYMYMNNCLFFDNETNELYFRMYTYYGRHYELLKIDKNTGHCTHVSDLPYATSGYTITTAGNFDGIVIPYIAAEASAPAKVQNLKVTPGANGALSATVSWTNPSKTFGRGGTLEDLDSVVVFRDGVEVACFDNPVIGGEQTWTDNTLTARGYYSYKIIPYNDMGRGDRTSAAAFIGPDNPEAPADVQLEADGSDGVLTWTAPTTGKTGGYINTADLKYDILRLPDSVKVATDYAGTNFTDDNITRMNRYTYSIIAKAGGYSSEKAVSNEEILGPAFEVPDTLMNSKENFNLWTLIDADGNSFNFTWQEPSNWSFGGASIGYPYDQWPCADWMISPKIHFLGGKHYKMVFTAKPGSAKVTEIIAVGFGEGNTIQEQDSIAQFELNTDQPTLLRANLPVMDEGEYNVSLLYRTYMAGYSMNIKDVIISEDHEGYLAGKVTANGQPVEGALVRTEDGQFTAVTDAQGNYRLNYLPAGTANVIVSAVGYYDTNGTADITELETTTKNFDLQALPLHTVKGMVKDIAGDPVEGADVEITGYKEFSAQTSADGSFNISGVPENSNYAISITKNKLLSYSSTLNVNADQNLNVTLEDNIKAPYNVKVDVDSAANALNVTWNAPMNDPVEDRIDDGTITTSVGISDPTSTCAFGVVRKNPAQVFGVKFYLCGAATLTHYSVALRIFDLDANGLPTNKVLYENTYVPVVDDQWTSYTLPAPVDCPNGYYIAISGSQYMNIAIDGAGDSEKYPFQEGVNCFTNDYTSGSFWYLESQSSDDLHHNFLMRPVAAPYTVKEDSADVNRIGHFGYKPAEQATCPIELSHSEIESKAAGDTGNEAFKTVQDRVRYNVYRLTPATQADESQWATIATGQKERSFTEQNWTGHDQGSYIYAVKAVYTGDILSVPAFSDSIGCKTYAKVRIHLTTDTPDNEAYGAQATLITDGGQHVYQAQANENGDIVFDNVWKTNYDLMIALDGFVGKDTTVTINGSDDFTFNFLLHENRVQPFNLMMEPGETGADRVLMWNYPDVFFDDFESHDDFAVNSPGTIGWQYIDGDGAETGGFTFEGVDPWPNEFAAMAYMVMNPYKVYPQAGYTLADYYDALKPYSGEKCLQDWSAYGADEDDWIITPKLYFKNDFKFNFYAQTFSPWSQPDIFEVRYSTSDAEPESFVRIDSVSMAYTSGYQFYSYDIPAAAKYVAIRTITPKDETGYGAHIISIDDISFGYTDKSNILMRSEGARRSPAPEGQFKVYLDNHLMAQTNATTYSFSNLSVGMHTAGVRAVYTSGETEMSTIDFEVTAADGIRTVAGSDLRISVKNGVLTVDGDYDDMALYSMAGQRMPMSRMGTGTYLTGNLPLGNYLVKLTRGKQVRTMKITL